MAKQTDEKGPRILLTFTGFHDPFSAGAIASAEQEGPVLSLVRACPFHRVILLATPGTREITRATETCSASAIRALEIESHDLPFRRPNGLCGDPPKSTGPVLRLGPRPPQAQYFIATASGTPQMHACWLLLAASGELPAPSAPAPA